jgi:hypothetical protein
MSWRGLRALYRGTFLLYRLRQACGRHFRGRFERLPCLGAPGGIPDVWRRAGAGFVSRLWFRHVPLSFIRLRLPVVRPGHRYGRGTSRQSGCSTIPSMPSEH